MLTQNNSASTDLVDSVLSASSQTIMQENALDFKPTSNTPPFEHLINGNEYGDAQIFINLNKNKMCYDVSEEIWYTWTGHYWVKDELRQSYEDVNQVIKYYEQQKKEIKMHINMAYQVDDNETAQKYKKYEKQIANRIQQLNTHARRKNVLALAACGKSSLAVKGEVWDRHPMLLPCLNGVIDLEKGTIIEPKPTDYLKTFAPTEWKGLDCPCPAWDKFLLEIFNGDQEIVAYLNRFLGYAITGKTTEHIMPVFYGQGRNGKGTIFEVLGNILGNIAKPCGPELLIESSSMKSGSAASPDIMDLMGRRMAWTSETDDNRSFNMSKVKRLTGNDSLKGRHLYKSIVTFTPTHKLILLTNNKPHADGNDYAFWKRIQLLQFPISFVDDPQEENERKRNPNLMQELLRERSGILASLVRGCLEWQRTNINPPEKIIKDSLEYKDSVDILGAFIDEVCIVGPDLKAQAQELYEAYNGWAKTNGFKPWSIATFSKKLVLHHSKYSSNGSHFYRGLSIKKS